MKLTFTYTNTPDLKAVSKYDMHKVQWDMPDEAKYLIGWEERVMTIAKMVGNLTQAVLHISCKEAGLKDHLITPVTNLDTHPRFYPEFKTVVINFSHFSAYRTQTKNLKILFPVSSPLPDYMLHRRGTQKDRKNLKKNLFLIDHFQPKDAAQEAYANTVKSLVEQLSVILNASPNEKWTHNGFHPWWTDGALIDLFNKRSRSKQAEERKQQREEEKRQKQAAKLAAQQGESGSLPQTGAGRRPGAIPGVFKGVQFRSQLEIRFATELEERKIRWAYEAERLGDGQYLVDFHLPDYKCWVEVKGKFEPRDHFLLKDTANYLMRERGERLFVYTQSKGYIVQPDAMDEIKRADFWNIVLAQPNE